MKKIVSLLMGIARAEASPPIPRGAVVRNSSQAGRIGIK